MGNKIFNQEKGKTFLLYAPLYFLGCGFLAFKLLVLRGEILIILLPLLFWGLSFFMGLLNIFRLRNKRNVKSDIIFNGFCLVLALLLILFLLLQPLISKLIYSHNN